MRFTTKSRWTWFPTILTGAYELELHDVVERLIASNPSVVVDVGCAEGYYAVGLATRLPDARLHAFDVDSRARHNCSWVARKNGSGGRVAINGLCRHYDLRTLCSRGSVLIVDCEGAELELLDIQQVPELAETTILVEMHDFVDPSISRTLLARFASTHEAEVIDSVARDPRGDWSALAGLPLEERVLVLDERRPTEPHPMQWAVFVPRGHGHLG
jgi:hypothetical protein